MARAARVGAGAAARRRLLVVRRGGLRVVPDSRRPSARPRRPACFGPAPYRTFPDQRWGFATTNGRSALTATDNPIAMDTPATTDVELDVRSRLIDQWF